MQAYKSAAYEVLCMRRASAYEHTYEEIFMCVLMNISFAFMIMCVHVKSEGFPFALGVITAELSWSEGSGTTVEELRHQVRLTRPEQHHISSAGETAPSQDNKGRMLKANWQSTYIYQHINDGQLPPRPVFPLCHSCSSGFSVMHNNREFQVHSWDTTICVDFCTNKSL